MTELLATLQNAEMAFPDLPELRTVIEQARAKMISLARTEISADLSTNQDVTSMMHLAVVFRTFEPDRIIEIGTNGGFSTLTWHLASSGASPPILTFDYDPELPNWFSGYLERFHPEALKQIQFYCTDATKCDWNRFLDGSQRCLFFIDAHDTPGNSIMQSLIDRAFPSLRERSHLVLVHDTTRMDRKGKEDGAHINVPYWEGGYLHGYREVAPLADYLRTHQLTLRQTYEQFGAKSSLRSYSSLAQFQIESKDLPTSSEKLRKSDSTSDASAKDKDCEHPQPNEA